MPKIASCPNCRRKFLMCAAISGRHANGRLSVFLNMKQHFVVSENIRQTAWSGAIMVLTFVDIIISRESMLQMIGNERNDSMMNC